MWTATIQKIDRQLETLVFLVSFNNGGTSFTKTYSAVTPGNDEGWLKGQIRSTIANLNALDAVQQVVVTGPVDIAVPKDTGVNPTDQ